MVAEQASLPGKEHITQLGGSAGDLGELSAIGNQGRLDLELLGDAIAVGADAILQLDLGLGERDVVGVAAGPARTAA